MAPPAASLCAWCGKEPVAGRKWPSCELCTRRNLPTTRYCSEACQAKHWEDGGHKAWHAKIQELRKERKESGVLQEERTLAEQLTAKLAEHHSEFTHVMAEGLTQLADNHFRYAERSFRRAIKLSPGDSVPHQALGLLYARSFAHAKAANAYLKASELQRAGSEDWGYCLASGFCQLIRPACAEEPKPEWWHDDALKDLSARALAACPNYYPTVMMRGLVLCCFGDWEAGPRTLKELKEAAALFERAIKMQDPPDKTCVVARANLHEALKAMEAEAAAELKEQETKAAAELREKEAKANAAAAALLAEEEAEKAAAQAPAHSGGKTKGKKKGGGKR